MIESVLQLIKRVWGILSVREKTFFGLALRHVVRPALFEVGDLRRRKFRDFIAVCPFAPRPVRPSLSPSGYHTVGERARLPRLRTPAP